MYSRKAWGGDKNPYILAKFKEIGQETIPDGQDPVVSLIIFEWKDESLIGRYLLSDPGHEKEKETICDPDNFRDGLCEKEQLGEFLLANNASESWRNPIVTQAIHLKGIPAPINYPIRETGFYCVSTYLDPRQSDHDYTAIVTFQNAYGELPAAQIAKLPFYGALTITYAVLGAFWAFLYVQNRSDILPVQNYITATIIFLIVEQLMTWGFYDYQNRHGNNLGNKVLMIVVSILNAGRNSLSFFLLLIVCMGYGVVKPSLGKTMIYVRFLAIGHFVFGVIYAIASLSVTPDNVGPLVLLVILPLAGTLTAFYVWTLNSLNMTMKDLIDRKQKTKAMMYKKLWWCILGSIFVIFGFFFINSFTLAGSSEANFVPEHWQTRWFVLDGWLNIVYLFDVAFIAYLWRPTANNRRFAMSDEVYKLKTTRRNPLTCMQLSQDDDGFEIRSIADSLDDDLEEGPKDPVSQGEPPRTGASLGTTPGLTPVPPMPVQTQNKPSPRPRESFDGETIFAVGETEWSDADDSEDDDRRKLTRKISS